MWKKLRYWHWLLALILLPQWIAWGISGAYMVLTDIERIRGQHLILPTPEHNLSSVTVDIDIKQLMHRFPDATPFTVSVENGVPEIHFYQNQQFYRFDATSGRQLNPPTKEDIRIKAKALYAGSGSLSKIMLLDHSPTEVSAKFAPVWLAAFSDSTNTRLYFSAETGKLVTKRHLNWSVFDLLWRLHIMDYQDGDNIHTKWLFIFASLSLVLTVFGWLLLFPWFRHYVRKNSERKHVA